MQYLAQNFPCLKLRHETKTHRFPIKNTLHLSIKKTKKSGMKKENAGKTRA
jgi:hypothetical protein